MKYRLTLDDFIKSDLDKLKLKLEKNQLAFISAIEKHYEMYTSMLEHSLIHTVSLEIKNGVPRMSMLLSSETVHLKLPLDWLKGKIIIDSLGLHSIIKDTRMKLNKFSLLLTLFCM